jgi:hypothetical protein
VHQIATRFETHTPNVSGEPEAADHHLLSKIEDPSGMLASANDATGPRGGGTVEMGVINLIREARRRRAQLLAEKGVRRSAHVEMDRAFTQGVTHRA